MGIDIAWKRLIECTFTWPEITVDQSNAIDVVIDDLSLNIRKILPGIVSWDDLAERVRRRVENKIANGTIREYWVIIDEPGHVPPNKGVTQRARDSTTNPFSALEMQAITVGVTPVPVDGKKFFERLMATRAMHSDLYQFIATALARTKLPENTTLFLDGFKGAGIQEEIAASSDGPLLDDGRIEWKDVHFSNVSRPKNRYEVTTGSQQLSSPRRLRLVHNNAEAATRIHVGESRGIGEGDLKIPHIVSLQPKGSHIYVWSSDTDTLPIMLLHMRNFIDVDAESPGYGTMKYGIYAPIHVPKGNRSKISQGSGGLSESSGASASASAAASVVPLPLDLGMLYRKIGTRMQKYYPQCGVRPIETLAMLMLITKTDYTYGFPQLGPATVWSAFQALGRKVLSSDDTLAVDAGLALANSRDPTEVILAENKVWAFIAYCYHIKVRMVFNMENPNLQSARIVRQQAAIAMTSSRAKWLIPHDEEIYAGIRRIHWTLHYWMNGSKPGIQFRFLDPFELHKDTGASVRGWFVDDGKPTIACAVQRG